MRVVMCTPGIALEAVVEHVSARLGISALRLMLLFARRMDEAVTVSQLGVLLEE